MGAYGSKKFKADLQALENNDPTLQSLNYVHAGLGDDGARALADSLRANRTLRKLQLGQCSIGAVGVRSLVQSLCDNSIVPCHIRRLELVSAEVWSLCTVCFNIIVVYLIAEYELRPSLG